MSFLQKLSQATHWAICCAGLIQVINESLLGSAVVGNRSFVSTVGLR